MAVGTVFNLDDPSLPEITTVAVKPGRRSVGFFIEGNSS